MSEPLPPDNTFDHLRSLDGEHVGYIHMTDDGGFVPYDLLHRRCAEAGDLDAAEALLDELGLRMFIEQWWLDDDGRQIPVLIQEVHRDRVVVAPTAEGAIAKAADMTAAIELLLPTDRLQSR
ncbi:MULTISPECIES: serine/threonine protein phosphatase [unclassified Arthrobacter]|uniref:serine/threonine protein phosphatase n=1 Tax=unclassified Arthrobacter TaxID=235627 RepID=UPI0021045742|nr:MULTISPECIES: serine/threonine protein phosphatase [unclassified Arthrobacter]MCQ1947224.1 serine/threonine protein phosphatase [Arthrobacter sp. zg-Y1116]MCQ1995289.1 serine/threonine protein phosphatase [Arthrobacter sp. zg-Y1171]UWX80672.1 serine/threonine protein phosphatase [Arthrobacter sp. zg-Y1171]